MQQSTAQIIYHTGWQPEDDVRQTVDRAHTSAARKRGSGAKAKRVRLQRRRSDANRDFVAWTMVQRKKQPESLWDEKKNTQTRRHADRPTVSDRDKERTRENPASVKRRHRRRRENEDVPINDRANIPQIVSDHGFQRGKHRCLRVVCVRPCVFVCVCVVECMC